VKVDVSGVNSRLVLDVRHLLINVEDVFDEGLGRALDESPEFLVILNFSILSGLESTNWLLLDIEVTEFLN